MAVKLTTTAEASKQNGVKMLVYGRAGVGKTMLAATCPRPIIISAESGLLSMTPENIARYEQFVGRVLPRSFTVFEIKTIDDLVEIYNFALGSKEMDQYDTIAIDSLSEIAETVLNNAKKQVKDPRQAYGELIEKMTDTIRAFRDIKGKHVYMSAKLEFSKDEATGIKSFIASMPGSKLGQQLPYFFDEVFHLDVFKTTTGQEYRAFRTRPDFQYDAKDRSGALDNPEKPDIEWVINKIAPRAPVA